MKVDGVDQYHFTQTNQVGDTTVVSDGLRWAHGLPDIPAAHWIDDLAFVILDLVPLEHWDADLRGEPWHVKDLAKRNGRDVAANMRGRESTDDGDPTSDNGEVDEVRLQGTIRREGHVGGMWRT